MADETDLKSVGFIAVGVQVPFPVLTWEYVATGRRVGLRTRMLWVRIPLFLSILCEVYYEKLVNQKTFQR